MYTRTIVRSAKVVGAITAGVIITASVGSAIGRSRSAGRRPGSRRRRDRPVAAVGAVAQPASWRGSVAATGVNAAGAAAAPSRPSRAVSARQALVAKQAKFARFTVASKATKDMRGVEPSLYRGKYYRSAIESKRKCIVDRESEGHYDVVNPSGAYRGAYQVSASLARGATWMMLKEHKQLMGDEGREADARQAAREADEHVAPLLAGRRVPHRRELGAHRLGHRALGRRSLALLIPHDVSGRDPWGRGHSSFPGGEPVSGRPSPAACGTRSWRSARIAGRPASASRPSAWR